MADSPGLIVIGVAGPSGSGKSLLSHTIVNELGSVKVTVITEDSYYKDHSGLTLEGGKGPGCLVGAMVPIARSSPRA